MLLPRSPQLPWIVLHDGTLFDLSSNVPVYQVGLPGDASYFSAGEGMLFLLYNDGRCSLMNALSGDITDLPELAAVLRRCGVLEDGVRKVVMSKSLPDHGHIIALLVGQGRLIVSTCRPAGETNSCLNAIVVALIDDIVFFQERLYALCSHRLIAFELNNGRLDKPTPAGDKPDHISGITVVEGLNDKHDNIYQMEQYLVESGGKLLMVLLHEISNISCEVWEVDMSVRRWKKVDGGLGGRALAVSSPCSMSVIAAADGLAGAQEDCIYFLHRLNNWWKLGSGVYNMRTKTFAPLPQKLTPLLQELTPPVEIENDEFRWFSPKPKTKSVRFPTWVYPNNATPTGGGIYGKAKPSTGGEGQPVGAKPWRTYATFLSFHPMNLVCMPNWIRKWDSVD